MRSFVLLPALLGSIAVTPAAFACDVQRSVAGPQGQTSTRNRTIARTAPSQWSSQGTVIGRHGGSATRSGSVQRGW